MVLTKPTGAGTALVVAFVRVGYSAQPGVVSFYKQLIESGVTAYQFTKAAVFGAVFFHKHLLAALIYHGVYDIQTFRTK
jgi:hypothetical protein